MKLPIDTFKNRLKKAMDELEMKPIELSEKTGIPKSSISQYMSGFAEPKTDRTHAIAEVLGVDPVWLLGYDVPQKNNKKNNDTFDLFSIPGIEPLPETTLKPLLGTIACGEPILAEENIEEMVPIPTSIHCDFVLRCKGDSMKDAKINDGDFVYVKCQPDVENGEIAAVLIDNEATLKRVYKRKNNQVELHPANPAYPVMVYTADTAQEIKILGKAIGCLFQIK